MGRRRGEVSLFEILRQPEAPPATPPEEKSRSKKEPKKPRSAWKSARAALLGANESAPEEREVDPAHGSTTPPPPEPAPRPRIDVTPPSRTARRLPDLPPLPDELSAPEESGPRWWERDVTVRPVIIGIAAVGVLLSWLVFYQLGAGSAEEEHGRLDRFAGSDAPGWDVAVINGAPGRQPEIRNAEGPDGGPPERTPPTVTTENALLPVIMVAQRLGKPENAESLILHIEAYLEPGIANVVPFRGDFAVFVGPFDGAEEAKEAMKRVRGIPKHKGTDFKDAYIHELEFTPEEQRLLGRD
jgi:hypothetical protein